MKFAIDNRLSMHSHFRFSQMRINKNIKNSKKDLKEQADNDLQAKRICLFINNNKEK